MVHSIESIINTIVNFPERKAFFIKGKYYSYEQFGKKIFEINYLLSPYFNKISPKHVGVFIYDDLESYASCICLLLSGYGYVPLNPLNPLSHNLEILHQAEVKVILSSQSFHKTGFDRISDLILITTSELQFKTLDLKFPPSNDDDPAYVIFTSGVTGIPKGVPINRRNLNTFLNSVQQTGWKLSEEDKFLQMSSISFDMSIITFIIPLCIGACIYTVPEDVIKYLYVYKLMKNHDITFIAIVPTTLSYLKPYFNDIFLPSVRFSLICGEPFPVSLADLWQECVPNSSIVNIYGPTEATVFTHYYHYKKSVNDKSYNDIIAIGEIVDNMEAIIIEENGKVVQTGEKGELCVAGNQLTNGYIKNSEKNESSFFIKKKGGLEKRFYKTGDIVFKDIEDCYYYVGRKDHQVKIEGYRIELGELEKHARNIAQSELIAVVPQKTSVGTYKLVLFIEQKEIGKEEILDYLKSKMPFYMIPSNIIFLKSIPLNINGKINRVALSEMISTDES